MRNRGIALLIAADAAQQSLDISLMGPDLALGASHRERPTRCDRPQHRTVHTIAAAKLHLLGQKFEMRSRRGED